MMAYKVSEVHVHGCVTVDRGFSTLAGAIQRAEAYQASSDARPDDGWGSRWIVTREGWYPTVQIERLYETQPGGGPAVTLQKGGA